jgi:hypothetical protein
MRKLTATLCLTLTILLGSAGVSESADFQKGLTAAQRGDFATALREWKPLAERGTPNPSTIWVKCSTEEKVSHRTKRQRFLNVYWPVY